MNQFLKEIKEQPQALIQTANYYETGEGKNTLEQISALWDSGSYRSILLTGMGSSFFIATATASLLNARGIQAAAVNAGELLHYQHPAIDAQTLLVCISQSGESYEVIRLIEKLPTDICVLSICNEAESTLVKRSRHALLCKAGKEEKTSTKTFITCYQAAYLLCAAIGHQTADDSQWEKLSQAINGLVNGDTPWMENALRLIDGAHFVQLISRGPSAAAASQSALMFMEAVHTPASALLGGEFRHGPLEMVNGEFVAILMAHSQSETYSQSVTLVKDILKYGGKVIFVTDTLPDMESGRLCIVPVRCELPELFAIPAVVPVQLIINQWADRLGITPGEFVHGAKVTSIE